MRILRLAVLSVLGVALVVVGVANIAPVDVHLLPAEIGLPGTVIRGVPLAAVILVAVVAGIVVGQLMEWVREAKHRRMAEEKEREVGRLRREVRRLSARLGEGTEDLPRLTLRR